VILTRYFQIEPFCSKYGTGSGCNHPPTHHKVLRSIRGFTYCYCSTRLSHCPFCINLLLLPTSPPFGKARFHHSHDILILLDQCRICFNWTACLKLSIRVWGIVSASSWSQEDDWESARIINHWIFLIVWIHVWFVTEVIFKKFKFFPNNPWVFIHINFGVIKWASRISGSSRLEWYHGISIGPRRWINKNE
jgi:hypothetical protein